MRPGNGRLRSLGPDFLQARVGRPPFRFAKRPRAFFRQPSLWVTDHDPGGREQYLQMALRRSLRWRTEPSHEILIDRALAHPLQIQNGSVKKKYFIVLYIQIPSMAPVNKGKEQDSAFLAAKPDHLIRWRLYWIRFIRQ